MREVTAQPLPYDWSHYTVECPVHVLLIANVEVVETRSLGAKIACSVCSTALKRGWREVDFSKHLGLSVTKVSISAMRVIN